MKNKYILLTLPLMVSLSFANSLSITEAYNLALKNSKEIKSLEYQLESSKESVQQAYSRLYPQLSFSYSYMNSKTLVNSKYAGKEGYTIDQDIKNSTFNLSQVIFDYEVFSKINMEKARLEAIESKSLLRKQEIAKDVFVAYIDVLQSANTIELYKSYLNYTKNKLNAESKKLDMNLTNKIDFLKVKVDYNDARINLKKEEELLNVKKLKLSQLIGSNDFDLHVNLASINLSSDDIEKLKGAVQYDDSIQNNLKIKQASSSVKMYKYEIENSFSYHLPKVTFDASYSDYDIDNPTSDNYNDNKKLYMVSVKIPLFNGGYAMSKVRASKLLHKAALEDLEKQKQDVEVSFNNSYSTFIAHLESLEVYQETLQSAMLYEQSVSQGLKHGLKSIIDLDESQYKTAEVKYKFLENILELSKSYIDLLTLKNNFSQISLVEKVLVSQ